MEEVMTDLLRIDVDSGKYTIVQSANGGTSILRYGEQWLGDNGSFAGVKCVLAMAYELEELRRERDDALIARNESGWLGTSAAETIRNLSLESRGAKA